MRVQLNTPRGRLAFGLALACALAAGCGRATAPAGPRGEVTAHAGYYADNDHVTVWNPSVRARVPAGERVTVTGSFGADIISAASVDVVASASRVRENRFETSLGAAVDVGGRTTVAATARDSRENDYVSDGLSLTVDRENDARDRAYHAEFRARYDQVGPGWVLLRAEPLYAAAGAVSVTQVVDRLTLVRVAVQTEALYGYQSSVYRYVNISGGAYPERVPELRVRQSAYARAQRSLTPALAVYAAYDLSLDNWGVLSNAGELGLRWEALPWLLVDARDRFCVTTPAWFYRQTYGQLVEYRTRDRLLGGVSTFWPELSVQIALPGWPSPERWQLGLSAGYLYQLFENFDPLPSRSAVVLQTWLTRRF